jgi:hypothetical protein
VYGTPLSEMARSILFALTLYIFGSERWESDSRPKGREPHKGFR